MSNELMKELISQDKTIKTVTDDLGSDSAHVFKFGVPPLDIPLGGGIYSGRVWEIFGWESQGKSTMALEATKAFANYWKSKGEKNFTILWIESESALDKVRAKWMGCPVENFLICEVETIEQGHALIKATLEKAKAKNGRILIVWDTIAAVVSKNEKEKGANSGGMTEKPRLIRAMFRDITTLLGQTNSAFVLVNQVYAGIGMFASDESPGGGGIKFHTSVRSKIAKEGDLKRTLPNGAEQVYGICSKLTMVKNKLTIPKQTASVFINNETGIDKLETCTNFIKINKLINVKGAGWCDIAVPKDLFSKEKGKPEMVTKSFQTVNKLREIAETEMPHLYDWIDYLIYKYFTTTSPLIKVKIIKDVWKYEEMFFGEKQTHLTEKEQSVASLLYAEMKQAEDSDDEG